MGVEVFFYNDNIWSCESDGELRLTIMSAMSQEESKHISDRVLAGHKTSREKGVLFGNGNILGYRLVKGKTSVENTYEIIEEEAETVRLIYDLYLSGEKGVLFGNGNILGYRLVKGKTSVENTYEIIEEEAETVRLIYDLYLSGVGMKAIASKLIELHRKKANGGYNWEQSAVYRVLNNKTYAGYIGYNKSYTASFLEHRRVPILDRSQYEYVKGNFPPIVSADTWNRVQALKAKKTICTGEQTRGKPMATDKWVKTLVCECGSTYKKYTWRVNKNGEESNGYQCRNQVVNRKRSFHVKNGLDGTGRCDVPSICEWKLDFMAKAIFHRLWKNQKDSISELMGTIEEYYTVDKEEDLEWYEVEKLQRELDRLQKRKNNLVDMRLDDLIDETQYQKKYNLITNGYQCRNQVVNRKRSFHVKNGLDGTGRCDVPSICEWKLDFMAKAIFHRLWKNQKDSISELMGTIEEYYTVDKEEDLEWYEVEKLQRELDRLQKRKNNLVDMRLDDLIDETQYQKKYNLITVRIEEVEISLQKLQCDGKEIEPVDVKTTM